MKTTDIRRAYTLNHKTVERDTVHKQKLVLSQKREVEVQIQSLFDAEILWDNCKKGFPPS